MTDEYKRAVAEINRMTDAEINKAIDDEMEQIGKIAPAVGEAEQWIKQMEDNERPNVLLVKWATVLADEVGPRLFPSVGFCVDDLLRAAARIEQLEAVVKWLADIEVLEGDSDGTWVAKTLYCNNQITAHQVRRARALLKDRL